MDRINNRYRIIEYIAEDACGHIYRVKNMINNRTERLKVFNNKFFKENAIKLFAERFIELSTIDHPNIAKVYEFSSIDTIDYQKNHSSKYFYTYEDFPYGEGVDYLSLSREDSHRAILEICRGLQYLHFRNECYMYLNFDNITFYKVDGELRVKFNDLAHIIQYKYLAKYNSKEVNQFLSPRLIWAETIDTSADLYSLGIVFYYLYYKYDYKTTNLSLETLEDNGIHRAIHRLTTNLKEDAYEDISDFISALADLLRMPYEFSDKPFYERLNFKNRLVGRDKEINRIIKMAEKSLNLECNENSYLIYGRKGVGKTRLLKELGYRFQFLGYNILRNDVGDSFDNFAFFKKVIWEIAFTEVVDINLIRKYGVEIGTLLPDVAEHWRISETISTIEELGNLRIANRIFKFLEEYVNNKQLIFIIDNLDNLNIYDRKVLEYLVNSEREIAMFIVAGVEVEEYHTNNAVSEYHENKVVQMNIVNYSYAETSEFISTCLGKGEEDIKFVSAIMNRTNGNPAMIIRAIERLFNSGKIYVDDKRKWDFAKVTTFKDVDLEEQVVEVAIDIEQFHDIHLKVMELLSICDIPLLDEIIVETLELPIPEFEEVIETLKNDAVINSKFSDWGFSYFIENTSLKSLLSLSLSETVIIEYHKKIADYLESKYRIDEKFLDDRLIYHLEQSMQHEKCAEYSLIYAERLKNYSLKEAQSLLYYNKALQHASNIDDHLFLTRIHMQIGDIYQDINRFEDAMDHYEHARIIAIDQNMRTYEIDALNRIGQISLKRLNYVASKEILLHVNKISRDEGYLLGELRSSVHLIDYYLEIQKYGQAITLIDHYIPKCDGELYRRMLAELYHRKGALYYFSDKFYDARDCFERSIDIVGNHGNEDLKSLCLNNLGVIEMEYVVNNKKALEYFLEAEELNIRNNVYTDLSIYKVNVGAAYFKMGKHRQGLNYYDKAIKIATDSNDKRDFFTISSEIIRDLIVYGAYDKAYSMLKKIEIEYSNVMDLTKYSSQYAFMSMEYFLAFGNYEVAYKWYTKIKKGQTESAQRSFAIKLMEIIFDENNMHNTEEVSESLLWRLTQLQESAISVLDYQLLRGLIIRAVKQLLTSSNFILMHKFIEYDKQLIEKFDCVFLRLQHETLAAGFSDNRIEKYEDILNRYDGAEFNTSKWITHKLLGDEYHQSGNYYEAMLHYTTALDMVKNIAMLLPEEFKRAFIINDPLKLQLKNRLLELSGKILHGRSTDSMLMIESEINSVDEFFNISELHLLFKNDRFIQDVYDALFKDKFPKMMSIEDIIDDMHHDDEQNILGILTYYVQILCADYGCIVFKDDSNGIEKLFEMGEAPTNNLEMVKHSLYYENEGLYVNVNEESLYTYLLKDGKKAILYIPIYEKISQKEMDDFDDTLHENEIGYIYLESSKVLNNFNQENFIKCRLVVNLVKSFLENYRLRILSTVDKLTGVYLRKYTEERFGLALQKARSTNESLAVIMCDIDKFKHVNDTYGHRKGDEILRNLGRILVESLSDIGFVGRYGGEEFLIILPDVDNKKAFEISESIRNRVQQEIRVEARKNVTISLGISCYPSHGLSEDELIENADKALYYSKNTGRNRSTVWSKEISSDQYRFDRLAGILTGNSAVDATNMQSIVEVIGMLKLKIGKEGKLLKVLENLIDITKGELAYIVEWGDGDNQSTYMKERGSNRLNTAFIPDSALLNRYINSKNGDYFVNWDQTQKSDDDQNNLDWKSIIVSPLFDGERSKGLVVVEVPISEREFDFSNYNYVNLMSGLISAII